MSGLSLPWTGVFTDFRQPSTLCQDCLSLGLECSLISDSQTAQRLGTDSGQDANSLSFILDIFCQEEILLL